MYMSNGVNEPVFGVASGSMKAMRKEIKKSKVSRVIICNRQL